MARSASPCVPLTGTPAGLRVEVDFFTLDTPDAARIRDLGIREGSQLRIIQSNGQLVVGLEQSRIGLPHEVAAGIFVRDT